MKTCVMFKQDVWAQLERCFYHIWLPVKFQPIWHEYTLYLYATVLIVFYFQVDMKNNCHHFIVTFTKLNRQQRSNYSLLTINIITIIRIHFSSLNIVAMLLQIYLHTSIILIYYTLIQLDHQIFFFDYISIFKIKQKIYIIISTNVYIPQQIYQYSYLQYHINDCLFYIFCIQYRQIYLNKMKLYSQLDKNFVQQSKQSQLYNNNPALRQSIRDQGANLQNNKNNKKKVSFKLQPQRHFQKDRQLYQKLFNMTSHIKVNDDQQIPKMQKSKSKRKKIFDQKVKIFKLKNEDQPKIQLKETIPNLIQPTLQSNIATINNSHLNKSQRQPSVYQFQPQKNLNFTQNRYKMNKTVTFVDDYDRQRTNKLLSEPILKTIDEKNKERYAQPKGVQELLRHVPIILNRLTQNQNQIKQLNQKIQEIRIEKYNKSSNLFHNHQKTHDLPHKNKEADYFNLFNNFNRDFHHKDSGHSRQQSLQTIKRNENRRRLQLQQNRRLELLIKENQYLTRKVIAQREIKNKNNPQIINIENRIEALKNYRLEIQEQNINNNNNFNNSEINSISSIPVNDRGRSTFSGQGYPKYLNANKSFETVQSSNKTLNKIKMPIKAYESAKIDRYMPTSNIY